MTDVSDCYFLLQKISHILWACNCAASPFYCLTESSKVLCLCGYSVQPHKKSCHQISRFTSTGVEIFGMFSVCNNYSFNKVLISADSLSNNQTVFCSLLSPPGLSDLRYFSAHGRSLDAPRASLGSCNMVSYLDL